jgi:pectate lyase
LPVTSPGGLSGATTPAPSGGTTSGGLGGKTPVATKTSPLYQTTTAYQKKAAPNIDMQSNIYMSPEEFAARTQLSNLFKVARGGLITLKNLR